MKLTRAVLGGGGVEFTVPHYSKFNDWAQYPEVRTHEARLARLNLTDPWKRNYAWGFMRTHGGQFGTPVLTSRSYGLGNLLKSLFYPFKLGLVPGLTIAATLIAIDEAWAYMKEGHTSWSHHGHGHGHGDEHGH